MREKAHCPFIGAVCLCENSALTLDMLSTDSRKTSFMFLSCAVKVNAKIGEHISFEA